MYSKKVLAGAVALAMLLPVLAYAETTTDTQAKIQSLMSQIQELQKQLVALIGSSGSGKSMGMGDDMKGSVTGKVSSVSGSSFVVQRGEESKSVTVNVSASTTIQVFNASSSPEWVSGSMADIVVGRTVGVQGTQNSAGSIDARMVKVGLRAAVGDTVKNNTAPGQIGKMLCIALNRNLGPGSKGDDVKGLQQMLAQDPDTGFNATATGVFGPLTAKAMMLFQKKNGISPSNDGSVGPLTRGILERRCGNGLGNNQDNQGKGDKDHPMGQMMSKNSVIGTITAVGASSITIQNKDGTKTATVNITSSTVIGKIATLSTTAGTIADLTVGQTVMVQGTSNSDGTSWTATAIHIGAMAMNTSQQGTYNGWEWNQSQPGASPH